jgi:predicted PurR-regulated permease PerM
MTPEPSATGGVLLLLFILVAVGYFAWCCVRILARSGHSRWWALPMVVPGVNLVLIWLFAYARWPRLDERRPIPPEQNRYMPPPA